MLRLGDVSVGFVQLIGETLAAQGVDATPLLTQYGFDSARLAAPRARLSIPRYLRLGQAASALCGLDSFGLQMGQASRLALLGLAGVTAAHAPTVREAARALLRFEPLYASNYRGQSQFDEDAHGAWLNFYSISPYNRFNRFVVDSVLSGWLTQLSSVASTALQAQQLHIEFAAPAYAEAYAPWCLQPVSFEAGHNRLRLSLAQLALRNRHYCAGTWLELQALCEAQLDERTRTRTLSERVTALLGPLLSGGREPTLEHIAAAMKLPSWTLRRKLSEEGSGFRALLAQARQDLAMAYIRDTEVSFGEIAYLLGFTSAEAFQRAFKRWCGMPPGAYRSSVHQAVNFPR